MQTTEAISPIWRKLFPRAEETVKINESCSNKMEYLKINKLKIFLIVLSVLIIFFYSMLWKKAPFTSSDTGGYQELAVDLKDFRTEKIHLRTPGYPLLMLLTGSEEKLNRSLFFISLFLYCLIIWLLAYALYYCGIKLGYIFLFCLVLALPPFVAPSAFALTENLTQFTLILGFCGLCNWFRRNNLLWLLTSAASFAYCGLTRPTFQLLCFAVIAGLFAVKFLYPWSCLKYHRILSGSAVIAAFSVLIIGGWAMNNYVKFNRFTTSSFSGYALSTKTIGVLERLPDEYAPIREKLISVRDAELIKRNSSHTADSYIWKAVPELMEITGKSEEDLSFQLADLNTYLIEKAPMEYLNEVLTSFAALWLPTSNSVANMNSSALQLLWSVVLLCVFVVWWTELVLLSGTTLLIRARRYIGQKGIQSKFTKQQIKYRTISYFLAFVFVLYTTVITSLFAGGAARYRAVIDPLLLFMCFLGGSIFYQVFLMPTFKRNRKINN